VRYFRPRAEYYDIMGCTSKSLVYNTVETRNKERTRNKEFSSSMAVKMLKSFCTNMPQVCGTLFCIILAIKSLTALILLSLHKLQFNDLPVNEIENKGQSEEDNEGASGQARTGVVLVVRANRANAEEGVTGPHVVQADPLAALVSHAQRLAVVRRRAEDGAAEAGRPIDARADLALVWPWSEE